MIIKYCPDCFCNPYTTDISVENCPICGTELQISTVSDAEIKMRPQLPVTNIDNEVEGTQTEVVTPYDDYTETCIDVTTNDDHTRETNKKFGSITVVGKVSQYTTSSGKTGYRRLFPRKIYQAIKYGQRLEDFLHSFSLIEDDGTRYVVNVHGTTNYGATIVDHETVEVTGTLTHDNILMAREVNVLNGGIPTPVKFQRSVKSIAILCLVGVLLLFGLFGLFGGGSSTSGFMNTIWNFVTTMFVVYVVLLILYVLSSFTRIGFMARLLSGGRNRGSSPLVTILIISFFVTLLLYNAFGIGSMVTSALSGLLSSIGPIVIMVFGILLLFKALK